MNKHNPVQNLFGKEEVIDVGDDPRAILEFLGKYGVRNLAYDGDIGCNPGYIFRGEADFDRPLQTSLERSVRRKLGQGALVDGETLKVEERQIITCFVKGPGGRAASIFHPDGKVSWDHPKNDVFWFLALMQHYKDEKYKTPTRLLDFTRDIRLALYFAIQQHDRHRNNHSEERDLIIYCFPCKDLKDTHDPDSNKSPLLPKATVPSVDMSLAIGYKIDVNWLEDHRKHWFPDDDPEKSCIKKNQSWGWDQPTHQNPRLKSQKGMFFYPYDYPSTNSPLRDSGLSWFLQNLSLKETDLFNLGVSENNWPPKRIRIYSKHAANLLEHLKNQYQISRETVYERYML